VRLSFEDARKLNIDEDIIRRAQEHAAFAERSEVVREHLEVEPPKPKRAKAADGMNKTELAFAQALGRNILVEPYHEWAREPVKVRLAGRTWYTPDFGVWFPYGPEPFTLIEVKGFMRDDAAVKLKVAAAKYPAWRWLLVFRDGQHGWDIREVTSRGIGREPVRIPWIQ
jgi:hypothetical protein